MSAYDEFSDADLLAAVKRMWEHADPPPADLADGVLARLAAEDLEFELLTLIENDALAGVRHAAASREETGTWSMEYAGGDFHAYLRLTQVEDHVRLDGWIVPARELVVELRPERGGDPVVVAVDEFGRFEIEQAPEGLHRLAFLDDDPAARPRITPPFWI